jgi:hypothetical protein
MNILEKLQENSTVAESAILSKSKIFGDRDTIPTTIPMLNVALSGKLDGGLKSGITTIAGASKMFKTAFMLVMGRSYLDLYADAAALFYDSEFGSQDSYYDRFGPKKERVFHTPLTTVEELRHDIVVQLNGLQRGDHVIALIDSLGMLASRKETEDAIEGSSAADMTRAKAIKSLFRLITPQAVIKNIPIVVVNHVYQEQVAKYPKAIVSGGTGPYLASDTIWIVTRAQEKDSEDELVGFNFNITTEKSRYCREKMKIPINVTFEDGINRFSGLLTEAVESGHVINPSKGWYHKKGESKKLRRDDTNTDEFWTDILVDQSFKKFIESKYAWRAES